MSFESCKVVTDAGPKNVMVAAAGECNLSCFMCGQSIVKNLPVSIDTENLSKFLESAENLTITGGEPLWISGNTNDSSRKLLEIAENKYPHLKISAFTNGLYLTPPLAEMILDKFRWISFSIDTVDPSVFKKIRGKDTLEKVLSNFEMLLSMKKRRGLGKTDEPHICVNSIVCESTIGGLYELAEYLSDKDLLTQNLARLRNVLGHEYIEEINKMPGITNTERLRNETAKEVIEPGDVDKDTIKNIVNRLIELTERTGLTMEDNSGIFVNNKTREKSDTKTTSTCPYPWTNVEIHSNGDVYCCCVNTVILGNVNRDSFDDIWNGSIMQSLRGAFLDGEMRGCLQESCSVGVDYFSKPNAFSRETFENFAKEKTDDIKSILMLRSAPLYQSRITAATLQKRFPIAKLTIVSNRAGKLACEKWNVSWKTIEYPRERFDPDEFRDWWENGKHGKYDLAVAPYNAESVKGCSNVIETLSTIEAGSKFMVSINGQLNKV